MMKNILVFIVMVVFIFSGLHAQTTVKNRYVKPTGFQKRVTTIVDGKTRSYYSLSADKPAVVSVKGPGKLRVLTRGRFVPSQEGNISYEVVYSVDGGVKKNVKFNNVVRSKKATYATGTLGVPGDLKEFSIDLGRGDHAVEFFITDEKIHVAAQYIFTPAKAKKVDWIAYSPKQPSEPVDVISKEMTVTYFRFSEAKPVKIEINGPTELRVMTRLEFHYQMKGRVDYRVQVKENAKVINTFQMSTRSSEIAEYKIDKNLVPGKACEFVIDVPAGKHIYEIVPLDKDKSNVLGRFLIPKKDVKNEN